MGRLLLRSSVGLEFVIALNSQLFNLRDQGLWDISFELHILLEEWSHKSVVIAHGDTFTLADLIHQSVKPFDIGGIVGTNVVTLVSLALLEFGGVGVVLLKVELAVRIRIGRVPFLGQGIRVFRPECWI